MNQTLSPRYTTLLPSRWGWFCGLTADRYQTYSVLFQGEWGHDETLILSRLVNPGDVVIDIGANVGGLTLPLAAMVGHQGAVIAVEPQRFAFGCLWANVTLNCLIHVIHPLNLAIGETRSEVIVPSLGLQEDSFNAGGFSFRTDCALQMPFDRTKGDKVQMIPLDDMKLERLDLLKADVEGMEPAVLRGATETIARCRPILWVEDLRGSYPGTTAELAKCFESYKYNAWAMATPIWSSHNTRLCPNNLWKDQYDQNVLALPAEDPIPDWVKSAPPFKV